MMPASILICDITMQLREYIDDTEDYINIQVMNEQQQLLQFITMCLSLTTFDMGLQLDNHRNQLIQVMYNCISLNLEPYYFFDV